MKKNITHIIVSLGSGGAEKTLYNFAVNDNQNIHKIITLMKDNFYKNKFKKKNIEINELDFKNKSKFLEFFKLVKLLKSDNPDIIITWLYHSDFIGSLAGKIANVKNIFWNIRGTIKPHLSLKEFIYYKFLSYFSFYFPKKIISCSLEGINQHQKFGYKKNIFHYIPNGISFSQDAISNQISDKLIDSKILKEKFVISMIARYHDQKNHHLLIESFIEIEKYFENKIILLLIGRNIKASLSNHITLKNYPRNNIIFLDEVKNINSFFNFIDLHVLTSSYGEGFPNVIIETLSNKIPNISSDVGDAKLIINNSDLIFKNNNKHELKNILKKVIIKIQNKDKKLNKYLNQRSSQLIRDYSIKKMISNYRKVLKTNSN